MLYLTEAEEREAQEAIKELHSKIQEHQIKLRESYVTKMMNKYGVNGGEVVELNGRTWKLLSYDETCKRNSLGTKWVDLWGYKVRKDGLLYSNAQQMRIYSFSEFKVLDNEE